MRRVTVAVLAALVGLAACTFGGTNRDFGAPERDDGLVLTSGLRPFDACDDALDYFVEHALREVGPYGLAGGVHGFAVEDVAVAAEAAEPAQRSSLIAGEDYSTTNVQEAGVDEPDLVKTDGRILVSLAGNHLRVVDVTSAQPRLIGSLRLRGGWGHELLLDGDRALVFATADGMGDPVPLPEVDAPARSSLPVPQTPVSLLTLVDLGDLAQPRVEATLTLDGSYVSARMVDGVARVVMRSQPTGLDFVFPQGGGLRAEREALAANREIVRDSTIDNWVPYYILRRDGTTTDGRLLDCERVHRPPDYSGLELLSVLTVDLDGGFVPEGGVGVAAAGETVYASRDSLYVATYRWSEPRTTTQIHAFDIAEPTGTDYVASGEVDGTLLNQWAMNEHDGYLRVATTEGDPWSGPSQSQVTILASRDGSLVDVGRVGGLGKGERIYSVRYVGDVAFVVTFRETDPLYTLDLSEPRRPRVVGELKILGYSAYLHPIGEGLLLGVGQDATRRGRTLGTQLSLFDVSDLSAPTRLHQTTIGRGFSDVEYDHRAFLHWPRTGLVVVPVQRYDRKVQFAGAVGFEVSPQEGFTRVGDVTHTEQRRWTPPIQRSLVVGDTLYTVSEAGVEASDLRTLEERGWLAFQR